MKNSIGLITIGIALITGVIIGYFQSEKWLRNEAIQGCVMAGVDRFVNADGKGGADVPNIKTYEFCLKEKGYK